MQIASLPQNPWEKFVKLSGNYFFSDVNMTM